jgi:hypothetical protein
VRAAGAGHRGGLPGSTPGRAAPGHGRGVKSRWNGGVSSSSTGVLRVRPPPPLFAIYVRDEGIVGSSPTCSFSLSFGFGSAAEAKAATASD